MDQRDNLQGKRVKLLADTPYDDVTILAGATGVVEDDDGDRYFALAVRFDSDFDDTLRVVGVQDVEVQEQ